MSSRMSRWAGGSEAGKTRRAGRGAVLAGFAVVVAAGLAGCGAKAEDGPVAQQGQPPGSTKGTRPGGALGAALGGAEFEDPNATPPDSGAPESTTSTAPPESSTTVTTKAPTTTATSPPVTQAPQQTVATVAQQPQQPSGGPPPSLSASAGSQPNCPPGPATVQVTINWTGSNLNGVQITGPNVSQSGPASGSASVAYCCHGTTRYNLSGSGPGGNSA